MNHYTEHEWQAYIRNQLPEKMREEYESHLYTCDDCLENYMRALDSQTDEMPTYMGEEELQAPAVKRQAVRKKSSSYRTLIHYGIAASITLMLTSSGFFAHLASYVNSMQEKQVEKKDGSFSENMMDKTLHLLDFINIQKNKGGDHK
ncbi:anti-sigma factor family protein [Fictibacillus gelatini]|uniref:anti-sigma factor family protein n=1 Tax=Fictibacillus gelatini TaxID=225985 RepID=UPI0003F7163F|nr:hypothetical protein [Fictibacillus gelatini]